MLWADTGRTQVLRPFGRIVMRVRHDMGKRRALSEEAAIPEHDWTRALCTLDGTLDVIRELVVGPVPTGQYAMHGTPSLRIAVWQAILSARQTLKGQGQQTHALRPYAFGGLPHEPHAVRAILQASGNGGGCLNNKVPWLIAADDVIASGAADCLLEHPTTAAGWHEWRLAAKALFPGIGYKTASMIAMVLWPYSADIIPCDVHVADRLGHTDWYDSGALSDDYAVYCRMEDMVRAEWQAADTAVGFVAWHWYKWSQWRQATGAETSSVRPESHVMLSPYWY